MYADLTDYNRGSVHSEFSPTPSFSSCWLLHFCARHGKIVVKNSTNFSKTSWNVYVSGDFGRSHFKISWGSMLPDPSRINTLSVHCENKLACPAKGSWLLKIVK